MRILVLSFYYPPDIGPGSLRAKSFVEALKKQDRSVHIDVMTTMPNRYRSFDIDAQEYEKSDRVTVRRIKLPKHQSGMIDQALAFSKFFLTVLKYIPSHKYEIIVATSGRLFTAALGAFIAKKHNAKLYLDIRDLFVDTISDVLEKSPAKTLLPALRFLEKWTFKAANKINVVSGGFLPYMTKLSLRCDITVYTNGIDQSFVNADFKKHPVISNPLILYAGNIGQGQGMDTILPKVVKTFSRNCNFIIVGDGAKKKKLEENLSNNFKERVKLLNPVPRSQLISIYKEADILFLHLNDLNAFTKVLPSKVFEYAATGKPILAGVTGFAADFLNKNVVGSFVFEPNNVEQMEKALEKLVEGPMFYDRVAFVNKFTRDTIVSRVASDILSL